MSEPDLTVPELRVLVAVEEEGGFTAAAARLGLTQSAVSHAVRSGERKLGAVLFDRGRHGARPTPAGARAAGHARRVLRLLETMPAEVRGAVRTAEPLAGPLRIAAFRSAAAHLLPAALARLTARHPGITPEVRIVRELGRGTAGEVTDGRADVGIATLGGSEPLPGGLLSATVVTEPYFLVHPVGHPAPRTLPLIDWMENCGSYTRAWWAEQDWIPPVTVDAEDDSVVLSMVAQGMGMAIMPALALMSAPRSVTITDLGEGRPTRGVGYVTTRELVRVGVVRELIRELRGVELGEVPVGV
ncbi:LysR family transcriptional regulator [Streptomyces eurocidicus]|uniref:DNA-binding transcriptional LysR family regulator n=1 Tax=Streptomyces eurocidicus TaxID=66423 RepID=A0A7W8F3E1_STREU|nr:LysR family transcriptional regulator [Streptomyces eurocidicus]MBB5120557.1 DNA-binding transcriptional LysR family regulator [Streptomyces eurocidicus]MBF6053768.1 LysR family transcriptional regulator [Streptomyces eurocidicus]